MNVSAVIGGRDLLNLLADLLGIGYGDWELYASGIKPIFEDIAEKIK